MKRGNLTPKSVTLTHSINPLISHGIIAQDSVTNWYGDHDKKILHLPPSLSNIQFVLTGLFVFLHLWGSKQLSTRGILVYCIIPHSAPPPPTYTHIHTHYRHTLGIACPFTSTILRTQHSLDAVYCSSKLKAKLQNKAVIH